jgi:hypothetical protein
MCATQAMGSEYMWMLLFCLPPQGADKKDEDGNILVNLDDEEL